MTDIIIYTTPEKLLHKQDKLDNDSDKSKDGWYYWELKNFPKDIEIGDKFYFATKGFIRGYFILGQIDYEGEGMDTEALMWESKTWKDINTLNYLNSIIPCKPFQGFKYADKVKELNYAYGKEGVK
jgi:hypothetical protein